MQSVNTRYYMYFNKRHGRSGSPFQGKYKAIQLENEADLMHLSRYIHRKSWGENTRSSYPDFLGQTQTSWLNTATVSDFFFTEKQPPTATELLKNFHDDDRLDSIAQLGEIRLDY